LREEVGLTSGVDMPWGSENIAMGRAAAWKMLDARMVMRIVVYIVVKEGRVENTVCYDVWMAGLMEEELVGKSADVRGLYIGGGDVDAVEDRKLPILEKVRFGELLD
jgi:hypothetical protein